jgi:CBS domain-containing protein
MVPVSGAGFEGRSSPLVRVSRQWARDRPEIDADAMRVNELMQPEVWQTDPYESLADAAARMRDHGVGSLAVLDGEDLVGILTERDLLWAMADGAPANVTRVSTYMTSPPVVVSPDTDLVEAGRLMVKGDVRHLPVVAMGELRGMLSARDLLVAEEWTRALSR